MTTNPFNKTQVLSMMQTPLDSSLNFSAPSSMDSSQYGTSTSKDLCKYYLAFLLDRTNPYIRYPCILP